jgi:hypothetical protein
MLNLVILGALIYFGFQWIVGAIGLEMLLGVVVVPAAIILLVADIYGKFFKEEKRHE